MGIADSQAALIAKASAAAVDIGARYISVAPHAYALRRELAAIAMDLFEIASIATRNLHSRRVAMWCGLYLSNALDSSHDPTLQRAAAAFRTTTTDAGETTARTWGFSELCNAYSQGDASGSLVQCHEAACYLALYFKALKQTVKVRTWLQVATIKAVELVSALEGPSSIDRSRLIKLIERLEKRESDSSLIRVSASMNENTTTRMWDHRQATAFFTSFHNHRMRTIAGRKSYRYMLPQAGKT